MCERVRGPEKIYLQHYDGDKWEELDTWCTENVLISPMNGKVFVGLLVAENSDLDNEQIHPMTIEQLEKLIPFLKNIEQSKET